MRVNVCVLVKPVSRRRKTGSRTMLVVCLLLVDVVVRREAVELLLRALNPNRGRMTKLRLPNPLLPKDPTNNIPPHPTNPATNLAISALPAYPTSLTAPRLLGATLQAAGAVSTELWGIPSLGLVTGPPPATSGTGHALPLRRLRPSTVNDVSFCSKVPETICENET